jgi:hypothetical protein
MLDRLGRQEKDPVDGGAATAVVSRAVASLAGEGHEREGERKIYGRRISPHVRHPAARTEDDLVSINTFLKIY